MFGIELSEPHGLVSNLMGASQLPRRTSNGGRAASKLLGFGSSPWALFTSLIISALASHVQYIAYGTDLSVFCLELEAPRSSSASSDVLKLNRVGRRFGAISNTASQILMALDRVVEACGWRQRDLAFLSTSTTSINAGSRHGARSVGIFLRSRSRSWMSVSSFFMGSCRPLVSWAYYGASRPRE